MAYPGIIMLVIPHLLYVKLMTSSNPWHLAPIISRVNSAVCRVCTALVVGRCLVVQVFRCNGYLKWVSFIYVKMFLIIYMNRDWSFSGQTNECGEFPFITTRISCHRSSIRLSQECGSLLQIRPPKFTHFNVIILQNSCLFLDSLAHHQGLQLYKTRIYCPLQYLAVWWIRCTEASL